MSNQKETALEVLQAIKNYISKQYGDIPTWEKDDDVMVGRIDELQCLETLLDFKIALQTDTVDEHYDVMYGEKPKRRVFYITVENDETAIDEIQERLKGLNVSENISQ